MFTVTTAALVALGYWAVHEAEPIERYKKRRRLKKAWRQWARAEKTATRAAADQEMGIKDYLDGFRAWLLETEVNLTQDTVRKMDQAVRRHLLETVVADQPPQA